MINCTHSFSINTVKVVLPSMGISCVLIPTNENCKGFSAVLEWLRKIPIGIGNCTGGCSFYNNRNSR
jgi:hypothetical protein